MRLRGKAAGQRGVSAIVDVSGDEDLDELWGVQKHRVILRFALQELRATSRSSESTIQAFERLALHGQRPEAVAEELGLTIDDVYQAKTRIASRLREIVQRIEALYDEDE